MQVRDVAEHDWNPVRTGAYQDLAKVVEIAQIAGRVDDILGFREFKH